MMTQRISLCLIAAFATAGASTAGDLEAVIDWAPWDRIVGDHVVEGRVDYDAIGSDPDFEVVVSAIATADLEGRNPAEILAFSINSYNALAIKGILDGGSPRTAFGKLKFFYRTKHLVAGERLSLNALEKKRIIPLGEPRIHFAIVCASASCPRLRSQAFVPSRLEAQLDEAARDFVGDPEKNTFDLAAGTARVSKIFKWFKRDFAAAAGSVESYIARYAGDESTAEALRAGRLEISFRPYDWSLNGSFGK